jgi:choline transport protein
VASIYLLARSSPKASTKLVWGTFINDTGWGDGTTFLTGLLTTCFGYAGLDGALHLAEECQQPRKTVPRATVTSMEIGFCTGFPFAIILLYSITDIDAILNTTE